ncbi:hypothetical protein [Pseudoduganella sp.]|uniref:hypothetical protein n=1 Tax=Pseudoduganella sp. TaxID=1880898 RepID=UPI0035B432D4
MEIKNNMFQRILSNVVGQVVTAEELEAVTGAAIKLPYCDPRRYSTSLPDGPGDVITCDN